MWHLTVSSYICSFKQYGSLLHKTTNGECAVCDMKTLSFPLFILNMFVWMARGLILCSKSCNELRVSLSGYSAKAGYWTTWLWIAKDQYRSDSTFYEWEIVMWLELLCSCVFKKHVENCWQLDDFAYQLHKNNEFLMPFKASCGVDTTTWKI